MKPLALLALLPLAACAGQPVDLCKNAALRRATYTSAILAADGTGASFVARGLPVPSSVVLAREAAVTARAILDGNCPG